MRVKLTEEQLHNLYRRLDLVEQSSTGTTTSTTGQTLNPPTGTNTDGDKMEKDAPNLSRFLKLLSNPLGAIAGALGANTSGGQSADGYSGGGSPQFAANIPTGTDLMHPLGPTYKVTSGFGMRNIGGSASKNHKGVDIGASVGTAIYAPTDGRVLRAGDTTPNGCGGFIKLEHPSVGLQTKYCHCSKWVVKTGDEVKKGQLIGYTGGAKGAQFAGNSMGPHLHYEVADSAGIAFNPTKVHSNMA